MLRSLLVLLLLPTFAVAQMEQEEADAAEAKNMAAIEHYVVMTTMESVAWHKLNTTAYSGQFGIRARYENNYDEIAAISILQALDPTYVGDPSGVIIEDAIAAFEVDISSGADEEYNVALQMAQGDAYYNLGLYYQAIGDYTSASSRFTDAYWEYNGASGAANMAGQHYMDASHPAIAASDELASLGY